MDALQSLFGAFFDISELPRAQGELQHTPTPSLDACLQNQPSNTMGALGAVGNQDAWLLCALRWDVEWPLPRPLFHSSPVNQAYTAPGHVCGQKNS